MRHAGDFNHKRRRDTKIKSTFPPHRVLLAVGRRQRRLALPPAEFTIGHRQESESFCLQPNFSGGV